MKMKELIIDNITYRIGENAEDNTQLINASMGTWTWFHLAAFPSCHVIVCHDNIDESMINTAANLVKSKSKYKFRNIGVNYCLVRNLRHGTKPGSVHFSSNRQVKKVHI